jgi:hypothetical protein
MQLFMAVLMTPSGAVSDFGGRRYHRFVPFNFLLSLAAPHLHGALFLSPPHRFIGGDIDIGEKFIIGVVVTGDHFSAVINLSPVSTTPPIKENP